MDSFFLSLVRYLVSDSFFFPPSKNSLLYPYEPAIPLYKVRTMVWNVLQIRRRWRVCTRWLHEHMQSALIKCVLSVSLSDLSSVCCICVCTRTHACTVNQPYTGKRILLLARSDGYVKIAAGRALLGAPFMLSNYLYHKNTIWNQSCTPWHFD